MGRFSQKHFAVLTLSRLAFLLLTAGIATSCFLLVGVTGWVGGSWDMGIISVNNPKPRLGIGILGLLLWYAAWAKRPGMPLPWKTILARFSILGLSLVISLFASEWFLRHHLQASQGFGTIEMFRRHENGEVVKPRSRHPVSELITLSANRKLIYELRANMDKPYGKYHVISNEDGLRESREFDSPKPADVRRILGIGDSGMFGWDVPQEQNYLATLEHALNQRKQGQRIEVLNGGVPGYNTQQEVEWLATKGISFEPEIVIVGWCNNDYDAPFFLYQFADFMHMDGSLMYQFLFRRQRFFMDMKPNVNLYTSVEKSELHPDIFAGMGKEGVRQALTRLREIGNAHKFNTLVFGPMDLEAVAISQELGMTYFNTYDAIPTHSVPAEYKVHDMHPMVAGHDLLAERLERELDRLGWLDFSAEPGKGPPIP